MSGQDGKNGTSQIQQSSLLTMTEEKMTKFIYGGYQKSKVEKEKEERIAKQKAEEEDRAAVYSEFVKSFEENRTTPSNAPIFVRGGMLNEKGMAESAQTKDPDVYIIGEPKQEEKVDVQPEVPKESITPPIGFKLNFSKFVPISTPVQNQSKKTPQTDLMSLFGNHSDEEEEKEKQDQTIKVNRKTNIHYAVHRTGEKSQLDKMYEELTRKKELSTKLATINTRIITQNNADPIDTTYDSPTNTHVYLGNLSQSMTEESLYKLCAYYGYVVSVSIKKQNGDQYPTGYVSMTSHESAERLLSKLQKYRNGGNYLRVGWAKEEHPKSLLNVPSGETAQCILVPSSYNEMKLIQSTAILVHNRGSAFESYLVQYISSHQELVSSFTFLLQSQTPSNLYYRWCLLVLGNNESFRDYSLLPFQFVVGGSFFLPPPLYSEKDSEPEVKRMKIQEVIVVNRRNEQGSNIMLDSIRTRLNSDRFDVFRELLRSITPQRPSILRLMAFCMDNSSCAEHIVCMLRDSICGSIPYLKEYQQPIEGSNERDVPCEATVILARVYVVNDLLYNADNGVTTPYRALLQTELPIIFEALNRLKNHYASVITKKEIKLRVEKLLNGWMQTSLLPLTFLKGLKTTFLMSEEELDGETEDPSVVDKDDALRLQCRMNGLCNYGSRGKLLMRLKKFREINMENEKMDSMEEEICIDPEIDGDPLDPSDYVECYEPSL